MTRFDDLDRAIDAYFDLETAAPEPAGLLDAVTATTEHRRPRATWVARIRHPGTLPVLGAGPDRLSPFLVLAVIAGLLIVMAGAAMLAGGGPRRLGLLGAATPAFPSQTPASPTGSPSVAPFPIRDGEPWIVYMSNVAGADSDRLFLVRPDGADRHQLPTRLDGQQEHPDWSPDGSSIVFERWLADATYPEHDRLEIWTVSPDGSNATRIVDCAPPCLQVSAPAWSPDGGSIAFARYNLVSADVWGRSALEILDIATGERRTVVTTSDGSTAYYHPRWSPDGSELVLGLETYSDASESTLTRAEIGVVKADGSDVAPRVISTGGMDAWAPDWHPTADRILFHTRFDPADPAERTIPTDIWVVAADGTELQNLSDLGLGDLRAIEPTWTPDGTQIAFTQVDGFQGSQIPVVALMDADGGNPARLGFSDGTVGRLRPTP